MEHKAKLFATQRHAAVGQLRKYTGEPYIVHPKEVMELVQKYSEHSLEMLAAAWLHDTLEDTETTYSELVMEFGAPVANLVNELTDQFSHPSFGNRAKRKEMECSRLGRISEQAQTIKLADLVSNSKSIMERDPKFAVVYLAERRALLEVLTKGGPKLWKIANDICNGIPFVPTAVSFIPFNASGAR